MSPYMKECASGRLYRMFYWVPTPQVRVSSGAGVVPEKKLMPSIPSKQAFLQPHVLGLRDDPKLNSSGLRYCLLEDVYH